MYVWPNWGRKKWLNSILITIDMTNGRNIELHENQMRKIVSVNCHHPFNSHLSSDRIQHGVHTIISHALCTFCFEHFLFFHAFIAKCDWNFIPWQWNCSMNNNVGEKAHQIVNKLVKESFSHFEKATFCEERSSCISFSHN